MGRLVKCPYCENQVDKDEATEFKKRYYHKTCLENWERDKLHRQELLDYICKLYKLDAPTGIILKQIKDFQEKFNYKLKGIELALRYFYETLDKPVNKGQGIGIVPYVYEDAKNHWIMVNNAERNLVDFKPSEVKSVTVEPTKFTYRKKTRQIDIGSL